MEQKLKYLVPVAVVGGVVAYSLLSKREVTIEQIGDSLYYIINGAFKLPAQPALKLYVNGEHVWTDWLPSYLKVGLWNPVAEWFWSVPADDERYLLSRYIKPGDEIQVELFERNTMVKPPFSEPPPPEEDLGTFYVRSNKIIWSELGTSARIYASPLTTLPVEVAITALVPGSLLIIWGLS